LDKGLQISDEGLQILDEGLQISDEGLQILTGLDVHLEAKNCFGSSGIHQ
jgi:hypothetical protein